MCCELLLFKLIAFILNQNSVKLLYVYIHVVGLAMVIYFTSCEMKILTLEKNKPVYIITVSFRQEWWTDLWLNEGFASWIEYLCVDHCFPEWDIWTQFVTTDFSRAMDLDALNSR